MFYFLNSYIDIDSLNGRLLFDICNVDEYDRLCTAIEADMESEIMRVYCLIIKKYLRSKEDKALPFAEMRRILTSYKGKIEEIVEECGKLLKVPDSITLHGKLPNCLLPCRTVGEKMVADYANISILDVRKMQYLEFRFLLAESVKYNMSGSKEGVEALNQCYDEMFVPFDREAFFRE